MSKIEELLERAVQKNLFTDADVVFSTPTNNLLGARNKFSVIGGSVEDYAPRIFDIASVTKLFLTLLTFRYMTAHSYVFSLDTKVGSRLGLSGPLSDQLTVGNLLTFCGRFNPFMTSADFQSAFDKGPSSALSQLTWEMKSAGLIDLTHRYANIHSILLGLFLEEVSGQSLESLMNRYILCPFNLRDTSINPVDKSERCIVPSEGLRVGEVYDPVARIVRSGYGKMLGSAGLFSTSDDLVSFLEIILRGENHWSCPIERKYLDLLHVPCDDKGSFGHGVGLWLNFRRNLESYHPTEPPFDTVFKSGFSGTMVFCSRSKQIACAICTNFLHRHRSPPETVEARLELNRFFAGVAEYAITL